MPPHGNWMKVAYVIDAAGPSPQPSPQRGEGTPLRLVKRRRFISQRLGNLNPRPSGERVAGRPVREAFLNP